MKAFVNREYGSPDVLKLEELPTPSPAPDEVLVRVLAAAANPLDYHHIKGFWLTRLFMGLRRPKRITCGVDFSGVVEAAGSSVLHLKQGDEVFGVARGTFAEYVCAQESKVALMGSAMTFEEAAAIPVAALTALQALRDKSNLTPGSSVLVNGASGGVGSYAVQIAKSMGAEVTAVCSQRNMGLMREIGADHVIDYTATDFTRMGKQYDIMFDALGNYRMSRILRAVKPKGVYLSIGVRPGGSITGPLPHLFDVLWSSLFASQKIVFLIGKINPTDLAVVRDMIAAGKVKSVIDSVYPFEQTPQALAHLKEGHVRGKVVVVMGSN